MVYRNKTNYSLMANKHWFPTYELEELRKQQGEEK